MSLRKLALAAFALALAIAHIHYLWFVCDDAFISFRYGANLAAGLGPVFNPGERVEGYTNFLWMLLSAAAIKLGGRPEFVMPVVSAGCALVTVAAVSLLGNPWAGLLLAASTSFAAWGTSGLETALFTMLVTLGYLACVRGRTLWAGLALGLASLTRPEGALIGACVWAYLWLRGSQLDVSRRAVWAGAALWAAFVVAHLAWRVSYYGDWLPNTFAIKTPGLASLGSGAMYVADSVFRLRLFMLYPILLVGTILLRQKATEQWQGERRQFGLLGAVLFPYLVYVMTTGGDFMPLYRFIVPMLPLVALVAGALLESVSQMWASKRFPAPAVAAIIVAVFAVINLMDSRQEQSSWTRGHLESVGLTRENAAHWARVGARLAKLSQPSDTLAISAAGVIPYVTNLYTVDLLGLTAADLSRYRRRATSRPGHAHYLSGEALVERPPQFLLGHPEVRPTTDHLGLTLDFEPEWQARVFEPYALLGYRLPGEPRGFVAIAVRHDAVERVEAAGRSGP